MDVKVNKSEWDSLTEAERESITSITTKHFKNTTLTPDPTTAKSRDTVAQQIKPAFNWSNPVCTAACGVAEAAAVAACSALSGGVAIAVCVAVAHEAGNFCRSQCP